MWEQLKPQPSVKQVWYLSVDRNAASGIETSGIKAFCEGGGGLGAGYPFKQVPASLADGLGKLTTLSLSPKKILHRNKIALKTVALKMGDLNYKLCLQSLGGYGGVGFWWLRMQMHSFIWVVEYTESSLDNGAIMISVARSVCIQNNRRKGTIWFRFWALSN